MKTKQILILAAVASTLVTLNTHAITVNFIEGAEGQNIRIDYTASDWATPIVAVANPESGSFTSSLAGNLGAGSFTFGLQEIAGGPASDWVTVSWGSNPFVPGTLFTMTFQSDTEGQTLQFPSPATIVVEDGTLQQTTVPSTAFNLTVGIQSDLETTVPDGGATIILLGLSSGGLAAFRRFRK